MHREVGGLHRHRWFWLFRRLGWSERDGLLTGYPRERSGPFAGRSGFIQRSSDAFPPIGPEGGLQGVRVWQGQEPIPEVLGGRGGRPPGPPPRAREPIPGVLSDPLHGTRRRVAAYRPDQRQRALPGTGLGAGASLALVGKPFRGDHAVGDVTVPSDRQGRLLQIQQVNHIISLVASQVGSSSLFLAVISMPNRASSALPFGQSSAQRS